MENYLFICKYKSCFSCIYANRQTLKVNYYASTKQYRYIMDCKKIIRGYCFPYSATCENYIPILQNKQYMLFDNSTLILRKIEQASIKDNFHLLKVKI